jgi:hypothetical protein
MAHQLIEAIEFGPQGFFVAIIPESAIPVKKGTPMRQYVENRVGCELQIEIVKREMKRSNVSIKGTYFTPVNTGVFLGLIVYLYRHTYRAPRKNEYPPPFP